MSHAEVDLMKERLLDIPVTQTERIVLLDMAAALARGTTSYTWGHDRLARAIGKRPGTPAAKQALSGRILPSLTAKGLIHKTSDAYPGHNAEYDVSVLSGREWVTVSEEMGNGSDAEWVTDSEAMGNAQTVTPPSTTPPPNSDIPHQERPSELAALQSQYRLSERQATLLRDLDLLGGNPDPRPELATWIGSLSSASADQEIREAYRAVPRGHEYRGPVRGDARYEDLSPDGRRWADARGIPSAMKPDLTPDRARRVRAA